MARTQLGLSDHLTHKANLKHTRYGWLRLTPAYSVNLVQEILSISPSKNLTVLDPFCGTGTTALVCAEQGLRADTTDINPFLIWLTTTKTQLYSNSELEEFTLSANTLAQTLLTLAGDDIWTPPLHQVEKWWDPATLLILGQILNFIQRAAEQTSTKTIDLLKIAFCRVLITHSNASFNHQSMSFKSGSQYSLFDSPLDSILMTWDAAVKDVRESAQIRLLSAPRALLSDARTLSHTLPHQHYSCVITSPPYPNRMSYIRELRPYMYWLGYLTSGREAGELDWQAIGGTWGIATSYAAKWVPPHRRLFSHPHFDEILEKIAVHSLTLSRYVHKYFYDMTEHLHELFLITGSGASINYIVGNSKFYDVLLPVEEIFASLFRDVGFSNIAIKPIRKRTSKKELYEYLVSATKP